VMITLTQIVSEKLLVQKCVYVNAYA